MAFVRRDRLPVIYVADGDGSNLHKLADGFRPSWSPDGRRIAFRRDSDAAMAVIESDGSNLRVVGTRALGAAGPDWSPDGQSILFGCEEPDDPAGLGLAGLGPADLCLADPDSTTNTRTIWRWEPARGRALRASFSPDGRSIAVMAESGLYVLDTGTGDVRWRTQVSARFDYATPAWSPDGRRIAFVGFLVGNFSVGRGLGTWVDIYVVNADGSELRRLTGVRDRPPESSPSGGIGGSLEPQSVEPGWWPDGSRLFFQRISTTGSQTTMFMMNADGTCETPLFPKNAPVRTGAAAPYGPTWRPGAHPSLPSLRCVDLALAPKEGEDTPTTVEIPRVVVHEIVPYTITVKNDGTRPATALVLEISVRGSAEIVVAPSICTRRRATVTCRLPHHLPPGGEIPFQLSAEATYPSRTSGGIGVRVTSREALAEPDSSNNGVGFRIWVRPQSIAGVAHVGPIEGTEVGETLFGRPGGDTIRGRAGNDYVYAGDGNDRIYGGDGRDVIHCGRGIDTVFADRADIVGRDCERVRRTG